MKKRFTAFFLALAVAYAPTASATGKLYLYGGTESVPEQAVCVEGSNTGVPVPQRGVDAPCLQMIDSGGGGTPNRVYYYDRNGNIVQKIGVTYNSNTGQLVPNSTECMKYDGEAKLKSAAFASGGSCMSAIPSIYNISDAEGNKIGAVDSDGRIHTFFGNLRMLNEAPRGVPRAVMNYGGDAELDRNGEIQFFTRDHSSSVVSVSSQSGALEVKEDHPYGSEFYVHVAGGGDDLTDYSFQGKRREAGLVDFHARHLDPEEGFFLQADSKTPTDKGVRAWNRRAALGNNPVSRIDPDGHEFFTLTLLAVALVMGAGSTAVQAATGNIKDWKTGLTSFATGAIGSMAPFGLAASGVGKFFLGTAIRAATAATMSVAEQAVQGRGLRMPGVLASAAGSVAGSLVGRGTDMLSGVKQGASMLRLRRIPGVLTSSAASGAGYLGGLSAAGYSIYSYHFQSALLSSARSAGQNLLLDQAIDGAFAVVHKMRQPEDPVETHMKQTMGLIKLVALADSTGDPYAQLTRPELWSLSQYIRSPFFPQAVNRLSNDDPVALLSPSFLGLVKGALGEEAAATIYVVAASRLMAQPPVSEDSKGVVSR